MVAKIGLPWSNGLHFLENSIRKTGVRFLPGPQPYPVTHGCVTVFKSLTPDKSLALPRLHEPLIQLNQEIPPGESPTRSNQNSMRFAGMVQSFVPLNFGSGFP